MKRLTFALAIATGPAAAAQTCDPGAASAVVPENFKPNGAVVTHIEYETTWLTCPVGQSTEDGVCSGLAVELSGNDAADHAAKLEIEGRTGWRLPTLEDFELVLETTCANPALNTALFPGQTVDQVWTSSPGFPVNDVAAVVDVQSGEIWGLGKGVKRTFFVVRYGAW